MKTVNGTTLHQYSQSPSRLNVFNMAFDYNTVQAVWNKAQLVPGQDPTVFRKDQCGAWIRRGSYGNRNTEYGWEIDHITPASKGGSDALYNLRPLQWENNASRQDGRLVCKISASGVHNYSR